MVLRSDERVAHCLVGPPRGLVAPCAQRALVSNFFESFAPARSYVFAAFSIAKRSVALFNLTHTGPLEHMVARFEDLEALRKAIGAVTVRISDSLPSPVCHDEHVAHSRAYSVPAIMMGNVRRCFETVTQHEHEHAFRFDYVTRVRPDAVFFARFSLPPREVLERRLVVPIGGLGGVCHRCANDHLALAPRHLASRYFEEISHRIDDCANGMLFAAHWNPWEALANPSRSGVTEVELQQLRRAANVLGRHGDVGYNVHVGIGAAFAAVGLPWHAVPWPYALSARHCCPTVVGRTSCSYGGSVSLCPPSDASACAVAQLPPEELARSCIEPLACERLSSPIGAMRSHDGGSGHNLTQYLPLQMRLESECRAWRCRA